MAAYWFVTEFGLPAPAADLYAAVMTPEPWLRNEPHVRRLTRLSDGGHDGCGRAFAVEMRAVSRYLLQCEIEVVEVAAPHRVCWRSRGDLEGTGVWTMSEQPGLTTVRFSWQVRTTRPWMNVAASLARPLLVWNHDQAMRRAVSALGEAVGVPVLHWTVTDRSRPGALRRRYGPPRRNG